MLSQLLIRNSVSKDSSALKLLYASAFPDEELIPLVKELLADPDKAMSLSATAGEQVVGHAVFSYCLMPESDRQAALLGPLAVDPGWHRKGIGGALVRAGFKRLLQSGVGIVFVLGDPAYYSRFGFKPESCVEPPFGLPKEIRNSALWEKWQLAWQSRTLLGAAVTDRGRLMVPEPWQRPELWAP